MARIRRVISAGPDAPVQGRLFGGRTVTQRNDPHRTQLAENIDRRTHPGTLSFDDWMKRPDVVFHGTGSPNWEAPGIAHFGPLGTAADVIRRDAYSESGMTSMVGFDIPEDTDLAPSSYMSSWGDNGGDPVFHEDYSVHARRFTKAPLDLSKVVPKADTDSVANAAHVHHLATSARNPEDVEVSGGVAVSASNAFLAGTHFRTPLNPVETMQRDRTISKVTSVLQQRPLQYENRHEGGFGKSYVALTKHTRSWEQDRAAAQRRGFPVQWSSGIRQQPAFFHEFEDEPEEGHPQLFEGHSFLATHKERPNEYRHQEVYGVRGDVAHDVFRHTLPGGSTSWDISNRGGIGGPSGLAPKVAHRTDRPVSEPEED